MGRKEINKTTWDEFIAGRGKGTITCPTAGCQQIKKTCNPDSTENICWNSYVKWTKGKHE